MTPALPDGLTPQQRKIVDQHGHFPDAAYGEDRLAARVLEFPDVGERSNWYTTSAVTLAGAYIEQSALVARLQQELSAAKRERDELARYKKGREFGSL